jgi:hypothetical protein
LQGEAAVYSVHDYVINIEAVAGEESLLVSLVTRPRDMTDLAIRVPELPQGVRPGTRVSWGEKGDVSTAGAERWQGVVHETQELRSLRGGEAAWSPRRLADVVAQALTDKASGESFRAVALDRDENPFAERARSILSSATPAHDFPKEIAGLVGLGIGFTPSGDDFISGALLAASLLGRPSSGAIREAITDVLHRTTAGGRTLLWLALRDRFPAYLLELAAALAEASVNGSEARVREATAAAFRHGETSGMDAVAGLAWYLRRIGT